MSPIADAIIKIRNEFPMDLVSAKRLWDKHGSYEAMRDAMLGLGFRPHCASPLEEVATLKRELAEAVEALRDLLHDEAVRDDDDPQLIATRERGYAVVRKAEGA